MENIKENVAKNISELRQKNSMTQIELAEKLNYSDKAISKWERGESIPDVTVLVKVAEVFGVTLDYLVSAEHTEPAPVKREERRKKYNHTFITAISIFVVWLVATFVFVVVDIAPGDSTLHWLAFIYAVPASAVVWLVFNSLWFKKKRNYLIVSILMWSVIASVYLSFFPFGINIWLIFIIGVPAQVIIILWSRLIYKKK